MPPGNSSHRSPGAIRSRNASSESALRAKPKSRVSGGRASLRAYACKVEDGDILISLHPLETNTTPDSERAGFN